MELGGRLGGGCGELWDWDLPVYSEASIFGDFGELSAYGGVEEGDPTPDFAAEWVEKGVVTAAGVAVE